MNFNPKKIVKYIQFQEFLASLILSKYITCKHVEVTGHIDLEVGLDGGDDKEGVI